MSAETATQLVLAPLATGKVFGGTVDQGVSLPHIVINRISSVPENNLVGGTPALAQIRLQVDVYADSYKGAKDLAESVKTAMVAAQSPTFPNWLISDNDVYENEVKQYRVTMDYGLLM